MSCGIGETDTIIFLDFLMLWSTVPILLT